jgi:biofilm PGA synthesis N-glycosyltransferase PgaC
MVKTELVMAIDPNAKLLATAIEKLGTAFKDSNVVAASDMVIPRYVFTHWESGRYVESILTYTFYKQVRNYYQKPVISSGCFSMYRTKVLQAHGGWPPRTLAEDIDLTWSLYQIGYKVCFISLCDPVSDGAP